MFSRITRNLCKLGIFGYDFWVVDYGFGQWTEASTASYNLYDAATRHTVQVYPESWTAIYVSLDNQGMWNLRSAEWGKQYLGQQLYLRVYSPIQSFTNAYNISSNALLCGKAVWTSSLNCLMHHQFLIYDSLPYLMMFFPVMRV